MKIEKIKKTCCAIVIFAMLLMAIAISVYLVTYTMPPVLADIFPACILLVGLAGAIAIGPHSKTDTRTPEEILNSAYMTICIITVLLCEVIAIAYMTYGYENFWIINPVSLLAILTVACIPLGAIFQLVVRIDHQLHIKKSLAQRG